MKKLLLLLTLICSITHSPIYSMSAGLRAFSKILPTSFRRLPAFSINRSLSSTKSPTYTQSRIQHRSYHDWQNNNKENGSHFFFKNGIPTPNTEQTPPTFFKKGALVSFFGALFAWLNTDTQSTEQKINNRPETVQSCVDEAFEANKNAQSWSCNGNWGFYWLLQLDEKSILKNLATKNPEKEDIYVIDVGCARGGWGREAFYFLLENPECKNSKKRFHIFSITGGIECKESVTTEGNVTLYQFNQFKIENIDEELVKRGFNLKEKVNLIVSKWTLRHLVDPFGTLQRMYGLLTAEHGMLLSNGFLFACNDSDKTQTFPQKNEHILSHSNAAILFGGITARYDAGQFLLMRNDKNELKLPLEYTNDVRRIDGWRAQCASGFVTVFEKKNLIDQKIDRDYIEKCSDNKLYCDKNDKKCKELYDYLESQKLFYKNLR